jgi:hypothetical protein
MIYTVLVVLETAPQKAEKKIYTYMIILRWFLGRLSYEGKRWIDLPYDHGFVSAVFTFGV